jgi:polyisoprenoid-binding protein YceI
MASALALATCLCARAEPLPYTIDPTHTFVTFEVLHFGTSTSRGRFERTQGTVQLDRAAEAGRVEVSIATASVTTGVAVLDKRLRGAEFLDSEVYPNATFVAEKFSFSGDSLIAVAGSLTLRGKTLPLTLTASHFNCYTNLLLLRQVCGGDFEAEIERSAFGITSYLPFVADRVRLVVQVEGIRQ